MLVVLTDSLLCLVCDHKLAEANSELRLAKTAKVYSSSNSDNVQDWIFFFLPLMGYNRLGLTSFKPEVTVFRFIKYPQNDKWHQLTRTPASSLPLFRSEWAGPVKEIGWPLQCLCRIPEIVTRIQTHNFTKRPDNQNWNVEKRHVLA